MNVTTRKADAVLCGEAAVKRYNATAQVRLKPVGTEPVRLFSGVFAVRYDAYDLKMTLDSVIHTLIKSGQMGEIIKKYPAQTVDGG